jgi:hypothetical protein
MHPSGHHPCVLPSYHTSTFIYSYICLHDLSIHMKKVLVFLEGQSDGSGEDDIFPLGSATTDRGLRPFTDQRGPSDQPGQQDHMDYPSSTLWSNSSRYLHLSLSLSLSRTHAYLYIYRIPFAFAWYLLSLETKTHVHHF